MVSLISEFLSFLFLYMRVGQPIYSFAESKHRRISLVFIHMFFLKSFPFLNICRCPFFFFFCVYLSTFVKIYIIQYLLRHTNNLVYRQLQLIRNYHSKSRSTTSCTMNIFTELEITEAGTEFFGPRCPEWHPAKK